MAVAITLITELELNQFPTDWVTSFRVSLGYPKLTACIRLIKVYAWLK